MPVEDNDGQPVLPRVDKEAPVASRTSSATIDAQVGD